MKASSLRAYRSSEHFHIRTIICSLNFDTWVGSDDLEFPSTVLCLQGQGNDLLALLQQDKVFSTYFIKYKCKDKVKGNKSRKWMVGWYLWIPTLNFLTMLILLDADGQTKS